MEDLCRCGQKTYATVEIYPYTSVSFIWSAAIQISWNNGRKIYRRKEFNPHSMFNIIGTPIKNGATILFLVHQHCSCSLIVTQCYILITIKSSLAMISKWEITSSSPLGFRGLLFLLHPSWWYTQKHGETHRRWWNTQKTYLLKFGTEKP